MQRLINPRFLLFGAIGLILGILCGYSLMYGKWLFPLIFVVTLAICLTILLLLKNKLYLIVLFVFIFTFLGWGAFQLNLYKHQKGEVIARKVTLSGRVTDIGRMGNASNVLYLEDCTYDNVKIKGRVQVVVFDGDSFYTGDQLTLYGTLRSTYIFAKNFNTSYLRNNCDYQLTDIAILKQQSGSLKPDESIRKYIYQCCTNYMPNFSAVMYALITGDDNALGDNVLQMYQQSGMVHLIAVSGMHLVYIITIIGFFIGRLKLKPMAEFCVMIGPLVFFCYICAWAPSILRALFMTVCAYFVKWISGRYDMVISLSFSTIVLLLVNPYYLFDVGWQLSALSVLGMATLHARVDRFLRRKQLNKHLYALLSSLSISLSCTLATFTTTAHYFGEIPILGVFTNLIGVPLMSWAFTLGVIGLLPFVFHYVLYLADGILMAVTLVAKVTSSLDFAVVSLPATALAIGITVVWLFVLGQYVDLKKIAKVVLNCLLCVLLTVCFVTASIPKQCSDQVFVSIGYQGADVVVTNTQGEVVVLSDCKSSYSFSTVQKYLAKLKYTSLTWVVYDFSDFDKTINFSAFANLGVDKVYTLTNYANDDVAKELAKHDIFVSTVAPNQTLGQNITVQGVYDATFCGALVSSNGMTFAVVVGNQTQAERFAKIVPYAQFYVILSPSEGYFSQNLTTFSLYQDYYDTNYGANKYGNFTITQKDDKIIINF